MHNLVYRTDTHVAQKAPDTAHEDATDFIRIICPFLHGPSRDPRWILNMDQTPVFYSRTIFEAQKQVECISVAVSISAAGDSLALRIVFKCKLRYVCLHYYYLFTFVLLILL